MKVKRILQYSFLTIVSILSVFPLFWMIISSTNKSIDVVRGTLLPGTYLVENFKNLLASHNVAS
ncbi:MAG TPA: carbohydrate ABC transporter permease, partial [Clostridiales bacterium]|nr:carbohydrate ABC transporter permease [Clostridiales bacterium]